MSKQNKWEVVPKLVGMSYSPALVVHIISLTLLWPIKEASSSMKNEGSNSK
jgi:hypothetical protein